MNNHITYYKMKSPYAGDVTKNCALTGPEVDNNFFTLEGRDVKALSVEDNDIVITFLNGEKLKAEDALDNFITNLRYNKASGVLSIYRNNGDVEEIDGIGCCGNCATTVEGGLTQVASDETLKGNGTTAKPLSVADNYRTGQFKPVNEIIETEDDNESEDHCCCHKPHKHYAIGDRFIVAEEVSPYGMLYDYGSVMKIACELKKTNSEWRIPTKEDWDDMLNAIEPCEADKDHSKFIPNKYLGKWASKLLRTKAYWEVANSCQCDNEGEMEHCSCGKDKPCKPIYCGEYDSCSFKKDENYAVGIDKYGFSIVPAGYADDGENMLYFGERAYFWTADNIHCANIFVKRFEYNRNKVHQDVIAGQNHLSLRLVKDYKGDNYKENETILGHKYSTVLMPSEKNGKAIWTSVNINYTSKNIHYLVPNNGEGIALVKKYYIDEWTGHKWIRNEFNEGDSVVVKTAPDGRTDIEYRIINNKLVAVDKIIYNDVMKAVDIKFDEVNSKIDNEIERSTAEERRLNEKVTHVETTLSDFAQETNKAFGILNDNLVQSINTINAAIQTEHDERQAEDAKINTKIENIETEAATHVKYTDIATADNPERKAVILKNHDTILGTDTEGNTYNLMMLSKWNKADFGSGKIELNLNSSERPTVNDSEKIAYQSELISIDENIHNEIDGLKESDAQLQKNIEDEAAAREAKDIELENKLIVADGTSFDAETGVLTLKSKSGDSDISVQFIMNFGKF